MHTTYATLRPPKATSHPTSFTYIGLKLMAHATAKSVGGRRVAEVLSGLAKHCPVIVG